MLTGFDQGKVFLTLIGNCASITHHTPAIKGIERISVKSFSITNYFKIEQKFQCTLLACCHQVNP